MASTAITMTTWTCDRCGAQEEAIAHAAHGMPTGWDRVGFRHQFQMRDYGQIGEREQPTELCPQCISAFKDWLKKAVV